MVTAALFLLGTYVISKTTKAPDFKTWTEIETKTNQTK